MLLSKAVISPFALRGAGGESIFNLPSALHEWYRPNATDVGTTITMVDTGSIGGLNMANPSAASEPSLSPTTIDTDGIITHILNGVTDFRSGDSTGVVYIKFDYTGDGSNKFNFSIGQTATDTDLFLFGINGSSDKPQMTLISNASISLLRSSDSISDGVNTLAFACNGTRVDIYLNGVLSSGYDVDSIVNRWLDYRAAGSSGYNNVSMGALVRATPAYYETSNIGVWYAPYVSGANIISTMNNISNNA